jgi:hypothetical protein
MPDREEDYFDGIALEAAKEIEGYFIQHHEGGRTQRLAKVQCRIKQAMIAARSSRTSCP